MSKGKKISATKNGKVCKKVRNGFIFLFAATASAAIVYYTLKENQRRKMENELLAYEVW